MAREETSVGRGLIVGMAGSGGDGIVSAGESLIAACASEGWHAIMTKSFGSQIRGGESSCRVRLSVDPVLNPGGVLVTCSCSYHVSEADFAGIVYDAAVDARAHVTVVEKRMQGRDHPVLLGVPETYYLKCFILRKLV